MDIKFDTSDFERMIDNLMKQVGGFSQKALMEMGDTLLNLSVKEVPHREGVLQSTGRVEPIDEDTVEVGYHTPYAARLHEHPEYHFQKGRKGKYLEDPLKRNLPLWLEVYGKELGLLLK